MSPNLDLTCQLSNLRMISTILKGEKEAGSVQPSFVLGGKENDMSFIVLINDQISKSVQSK